MPISPMEIRYNAANQRLTFLPVRNARSLEGPLSAVLTLFDADGKARLLDEIAMAWNESEGHLSCTFDTTGETWIVGENCRAVLSWSSLEDSGVDEFFVDVLRDVWEPSLCVEDLHSLAPATTYRDDSDNPVLAHIIRVAEEELRLELKTYGLPAGIIRNKAALNRCHRLLALSLLYLRLSSDNSGAYADKSIEYRTRFERAIAGLLSNLSLDANQDSLSDGARRNLSGARLKP